MGIGRHVWGLALTAIACGCGGEIDGSSSVVTGDGKLHTIPDVYGPSATASSGPAGDWTLDQIDAFNEGTSTLLSFLAGGQLGVTSLSSTIDYDDEKGDRVVRTVTTLWAGPKHGQLCQIANRWRMLDEHRLGLLFTCADGVGREAIFRFPLGSSFSPPDTQNKRGRSYLLILDAFGAEPGPAFMDAVGRERFGIVEAE